MRRNPHAETDKAQRVQRMFASIAWRYDLNNRLHSFGRDRVWRRRTVERCAVRAHEDHVLDVACGTGDLALAFAAAQPASIIGLDYTPEMISLARVKAAARNGNVASGNRFCSGLDNDGGTSDGDTTPRENTPAVSPAFLHGDALDLPFNDASFDVVSIAFGIRNVSDPIRALREFHRVLRPGGRLAILEFSRPANPLVRLGCAIYCDRIMPLTATFIANDRSGAYRYLPRSVRTFLDPAQIIDLLGREHFVDVQAWPMTLGICTLYVARRGGPET